MEDLGFDKPVELRDSPRAARGVDKPLEMRDSPPMVDLGFDKPLENRHLFAANWLGATKVMQCH